MFLIGVGSEAYFHYKGFGSYPVYDLDDNIKYLPSADQHGIFLNRNAWYFNNRHMGNKSDWTSDRHPNILLIGNSIVLGGLPYDHEDKIGPLLEHALAGETTVWSVAAGGWTSINEMAYLDRNPDVLQNSDLVVLEYMAGGLSTFSSWPGFFVFPDRKPLFLTPYLVGKYLPRLLGRHVNESGSLPPTGETDDAQLIRFKTLIARITKTTKLVIFMYPTRHDLSPGSSWHMSVAAIHEICHTYVVRCLDLGRDKRWTDTLYRDDGVHPTVEGNKVLAEILASALQERNTVSSIP